MLRTFFATLAFAVACIFVFAPDSAHATIQGDFNAVCSAGGGTVNLAANVTALTTQTLNCSSTTHPITLQGAPTVITCSDPKTACIVLQSPKINLKDVWLVGPGHGPSNAGSEGLVIQSTADFGYLSNIRINNFDVGLHMIGASDLLIGVHFETLTIGNPSDDVNTAVHLDGAVADDYIMHFGLSAQNRAILWDGPGYSGGSVSFVSGYLNSTLSAGTAAVYIDTSDASEHIMLLADVQDWETACPYAELGSASALYINGMAFNGNAPIKSNDPAFKLDGTYDYLRLTNADVGPCGTAPYTLATINSSLSTMSIGNSDIVGTVNFVGAASATFTGNRFLSGACATGSLTNLRAAANFPAASCPDR